MTDLFVDTAGFASWLIADQRFHDLAARSVVRAKKDRRQLVTTNLVLSELVALFTSPIRLSRPIQINILKTLRHPASGIEIIHVDPSFDDLAWKLWESRPDKEWSLVDCASFAVMSIRELNEALTTDRHFEQAGFIRLLK